MSGESGGEGAPVRIPKDKATRDRLAAFAGLTDEERQALDQWCYEQAEEDRRRQRRGLEQHGDSPMARGLSGSSAPYPSGDDVKETP